jgi:hypothetical protein
MNRFKLYQPLWWVLHAVAIAAIFWLGHAVTFPPGYPLTTAPWLRLNRPGRKLCLFKRSTQELQSHKHI